MSSATGCPASQLRRWLEANAPHPVEPGGDEVTPGTAYLRRKRSEASTRTRMQQLVDDAAGDVHDRLSARSAEAIIRRAAAGGSAARRVVALDAVYLVERAHTDAFRAELERSIQERAALGFASDLTGPWPPYHFTAVDLSDPPPSRDG